MNMPRPKSQITSYKINIVVRVNNKQKEMFKDIGGAEWLRNYLNRQIRSEEIQLGINKEERR